MRLKRDACPKVGGRYWKNRPQTLVRLCLTDILIQPAVNESKFSALGDGNAAVGAGPKPSEAETCAGGILWRPGQPGRSALLCVFTGSERLRAELSDNICAESHFRLCLTGVRAPSAEANRIRTPAYIRACVRVRVHAPQTDYIAVAHVAARKCVSTPAQTCTCFGCTQRFCRGGTLTRFFKVTQSRHIKKLHAHPSEAQFLNDVVTLKFFFKKKERNEKKRKSKVEPRHL